MSPCNSRIFFPYYVDVPNVDAAKYGEHEILLLIYFLVKRVANSASVMAVLLSSTQELIASFSVLVP